MLELPETYKGFSQPGDNLDRDYDLDVLCDWIEASTLFTEPEGMSKHDIADYFGDDQAFADDDFGELDMFQEDEFNDHIVSESSSMIDDAWSMLREGVRWLGPCSPIQLDQHYVAADPSWKGYPAFSFLLLASLTAWYPSWAKQFPKLVSERGSLFELVSKEALEQHFSGWSVSHAGWSGENTLSFRRVVDLVSQQVLLDPHEVVVKQYDHTKAKDRGLDLIATFPLSDDRVGRPTILFQCATGVTNWKSKSEAGRKRWIRMFPWPYKPAWGLVIPFGLQREEFNRFSGDCYGPLFDRYRLLSLTQHGWESEELATQLIDWCQPKIEALPWTS